MTSNNPLNLEERAQLFKALGHPTRLLILNLLHLKPRHGEELAAILNLKPATISHHLSKLSASGIVAARKEQYYQVYSLVNSLLARTVMDLITLPESRLSQNTEADAYRDKVLRTFFSRGRLTNIPAQRKKRRIVLEKLVEEFEPEQTYTEMEVNHTLLDFHNDVETLRRELIAEKLMTRSRGIYQRIMPQDDAQ